MSTLDSSLSWSTIRADAVETFRGQTPRPDDEAAIIDIFETQPQLVQHELDQVARSLADGKITYPWSALRARLERRTTALREATVDVTTDRARRIRNAEQWLENAGLHYDLEHHVAGELFGDPDLGTSGLLSDYANDDELRDRMLAKWRELRPRGEQAEHDHETYMQRQVEQSRRRRELELAAKRKTLEQLAHAHDA
jgi:hypothetical protein